MRTLAVVPTVADKVLWLALRVFLGLAVLAIALMAGLAFAQAPAAAPASSGVDWDGVLSVALKVLGLIVTALLLPKLRALIAAHEADKNASASDTALWTLLDKTEHFVEVGVAGAMPVVQGDLSTGKSAADIAKDAAASAKAYLGTAGLGELGDVLGLAGDALTKYLQDLAAKKVAAAQAAGSAAAQRASATPQAAVAAVNG